MKEIVNAGWMYALAAFICIFVLATSLAFLAKANHDARRLGMDKGIIKRAVISSALFSLLPSISILIGVIALSGTIGIPLPWIRLSVIGALHYEQTAVEAAYPGITLAAMTPRQFVTIATVMTLGIMSGPLFCLIGFKKYDNKILVKTKASSESQKEKKKAFSPILFNAAFIALICAFLAEGVGKLRDLFHIGTADAETGEIFTIISAITPTAVIITSFLVMWLMTHIAKKAKLTWLGDFAIGISMLCGMGVAVLISIIGEGATV